MTESNDFESIVSDLDLGLGIRDTVLDLDAEWFTKHHRVRVRFRPLLRGEFGDEADERLANSGYSGPFMVVVIRDVMRILVKPLLFETFEDDIDD